MSETPFADPEDREEEPIGRRPSPGALECDVRGQSIESGVGLGLVDDQATRDHSIVDVLEKIGQRGLEPIGGDTVAQECLDHERTE